MVKVMSFEKAERTGECAEKNGIKLKALLETAKAYYNRGTWIQYDELSMDRMLRITPRRYIGASPEEATREHTVHLDCSSFVWSVFKHAFDYELPADITWEMIDLIKPRVFYYEVTHNETTEEKDRVKTAFREILQPGDVVVTEYENNGHTLIFLGDGKYIHCTSAGVPCSYDYAVKKDHFHQDFGGVHIDSSAYWYEENRDPILGRNYLFRPTMKRFCILRPLAYAGEPTEEALARIGACRELVCAVENSLVMAEPDSNEKRVIYTVRVRNIAPEKVNVMILFEAPNGTKAGLPCNRSYSVQTGEEIIAEFPVTIQENVPMWLDPPAVSVNGLRITAQRVYADIPGAIDIEHLNETIKTRITAGEEVLSAASAVYGEHGILLESNLHALLATLFYRRDSSVGNILVRKKQQPQQDGGVFGLFGGHGVITPEVMYDAYIRCRRIQREDLQPGDILVCCDDAYMQKAYVCYYTGDLLCGKTEMHSRVQQIRDAELDTYLGTLFGRFCFVVIRPYLMKKRNLDV